MKMTTRVAYCNMRHYKSKNILIGIAIILTTLLLFVIPSIGKDMVEVNFAVINKIYPTWHALYRNVDESTVMKLAAHHDVKTYGLRSDAVLCRCLYDIHSRTVIALDQFQSSIGKDCHIPAYHTQTRKCL